MTSSSQGASDIIGDRYRPLELLGRGGMGSVHAALDLATGEHVALKRLAGASAHIRRLFEREFRTLRSLRHPRIVEVFDYGLDGDTAFYTMELLEGHDLTGAAPMPWRDVCLCLRDAASILGVLHARHLVHRDLSPRNLWRCPDGRLKLLDFGALSPFGIAKEVVGTPPLVPPEVLLRKDLDGRSDLYALGALGYWLLTGAHAFRAGSLGELPALWEHEPPAPSRLVDLVRRGESPVPEALDRLITSLLQRDKADRPRSTVDVIDSLNAIADLEHESVEVVVQAYLERTDFVGREPEVRSYRKRLVRAAEGTPQALLIEADEGLGGTRLLEELALTATLGGARVLRCDATAADRPFGAAASLAICLLRALPLRARRAAAPHAPVLAHLDPEVRRALGEGVRPAADHPGASASDERSRMQAALTAWIGEISRDRPLALFADDLHALDDDSRALLAALAFLEDGHRLIIAATTEIRSEHPPATRALASRARRLTLTPLEPTQSRQMLRSVFGATHHLDRVAARLHALSEGNPRHCVMLAQHLVRTGVAHYIEGSWSLPKELPEAGLPRSVRAGLVAVLERIDGEARGLARRLSVPDRGTLSLAMAEAVHVHAVPVGSLLAELTAGGVLRRSADGFAFTHPVLRETLFAELGETARPAAHRAFAEVLQRDAGDDPTQQVRAAVHWIRAGEASRGEALIARVAAWMLDGHVEHLRDCAELVEEAVGDLRAAGRSNQELLYPLTLLCCAAYYADPKYAARHGASGVEALQRALHMHWLPRLRWLGRKLALVVCLAVSGIRLRRIAHAPAPRDAVRALIMVCTTLGGVASTALEPARARAYARIIKPLSALGRNHIATVCYRMLQVIAMSSEERAGATYERAVRLRDWLGGGTRLAGVTPELRETLLASAWFLYGVRSSFRDDGSANEAAQHLEEFGPVHEVNAHQLRAMHHAGRGDTEQSDYHRDRMGVLAIQQGSAWRAEAFAPTVTMPFIWAHDAVALKRAAEQLERLTIDFPGFANHVRPARAAYHLLRGKPKLAIELLEPYPSEPLKYAGWARTRSILAAAYNEVGRHGDARRTCLDALAHLTPEDLELVGLNVNLTAELAVAEAGLGKAKAGAERLDHWIAHCANRGPLLQCYLHRTRARLALLARDAEACRVHLDASERFARETTTPSPLAAIRHLRQRLHRLQHPNRRTAAASLLDSSLELTAVVQLMLQGEAGERRGEKVMRIAAEVAGAQFGYFVPADDDEPLLSLQDDTIDPDLLQWARVRLHASSGNCDEDVTADLPADAPLTDPNVTSYGGRHYCLKAFWTVRRGMGVAVGALVLGFESKSAQLPAPEVMTVLSTYLTEVALPSQTLPASGTKDALATVLDETDPGDEGSQVEAGETVA